MAKFLFVFLSFFSISALAYSPKLLLIEQSNGFKQYLDEKSIKKIDKNLMSVMIYEKFDYKSSDEYAEGYRSAIKKYIVDCPYKSLAMGAAQYYSGLTSNSEFVGAYNNILGHAEDGSAVYFYDDLIYLSIKNSQADQKIYKRVCIGK